MGNLKMLPWLARNADISDARARELWAEAIRYATARTDWVGTPEFWKTAMDDLLERIAALVPQTKETARAHSLRRTPPVIANRTSAPPEHDVCMTCCTIC